MTAPCTLGFVSALAMAIAREKCSKKTRLLADYQSATARFSVAVTDLNEKMGVSPKSEYDRLRMAARVLSVSTATERTPHLWS